MMIKERPSVTIAVVTYQSAALLPAFFDTLEHGVEGSPTCEVVVADNDSSDGTADLARQIAPGATVIDLGGNKGYSAGINAAVEAVPPRDALLVLNPDIRLRRGAVAILLEALQHQPPPEVGIAVPRLVSTTGATAPSLRRAPTVRRALGEAVLGGRLAGRFEMLGEVVRDPARYTVGGSADWASGAAMMISARCLEAVGPWDESFFLYAEETDYALRAADAGFVLRYVPAAEAVHIGGESHESPELWSLLMRNRVRLFARRHGRVRAAGFRAALLLNEAVRAAAGDAVHRAGFRALLRPLTDTRRGR